MTAVVQASDLVRAVLRATNTHEAEAPIAQALAQAHAEGLRQAADFVDRGGLFGAESTGAAAQRIRSLAAGVAGQPSGDAKAEGLRAENTRLQEDVNTLQWFRRNLHAAIEKLEGQLAAAVAANTPLKDAAERAEKDVQSIREMLRDGKHSGHDRLWLAADTALGLLRGVRDSLRTALEKPSVTVPAVTGTTSDKAPIRKPAAGDAKGK